MASRKLTQFIATPSRVASALDWKRLGGSVLSLDIGKDQIGMAIASHPSTTEFEPKLESIRLKYDTRNNRKVLNDEVVDQLQSVVHDYKVCALVVGWPLQKEGRCGAPCGQVLHTLDCLVDSHLFKNRPLCLWNEDMVVPRSADSFDEDEFGRSPMWAKPSKKDQHLASKEQYEHHQASAAVAADIWNDFCESQWPGEAYKKKEASGEFFDPSWLEDFSEGGASLRVSLL